VSARNWDPVCRGEGVSELLKFADRNAEELRFANEAAPVDAADDLREGLGAEVAHDARLAEHFVAVVAHDNPPPFAAPPALLLGAISRALHQARSSDHNHKLEQISQKPP
jgi:hypothetical protein